MGMLIYKKRHKKKIIARSVNKYLSRVMFAFYGMKAAVSSVLMPKQVETARRVISRITKRTGKVVIRVFFTEPITKKALASRMGKGVGPVKLWIARIPKGMVFLEIGNVSKLLAFKAFKAASLRLPMKVEFVSRDVYTKTKFN